MQNREKMMFFLMMVGVLTWLGFLVLLDDVSGGFQGFEKGLAFVSYSLFVIASGMALWVLFSGHIKARIPIFLWFLLLPVSVVPFTQVKQPLVPIVWSLLLLLVIVGSVVYRHRDKDDYTMGPSID